MSGGADKTIRVWSTLDKKEKLKTLQHEHNGTIKCIDISESSGIFVSGSEDNFVKIFDLHTGKSSSTLRGHSAEVSTCQLVPDRQLLVTGGRDTTVKLWDLRAPKCVHSFTGHSARVNSVQVYLCYVE